MLFSPIENYRKNAAKKQRIWDNYLNFLKFRAPLNA